MQPAARCGVEELALIIGWVLSFQISGWISSPPATNHWNTTGTQLHGQLHASPHTYNV
jgi:hypothetical protein